MKKGVFILLFLVCPVISYAEKVKIKTAPVHKQHLTRSIEKTGSVIPWKTIKVSTQINGLLEKINVEKGDIVKINTIIADIDRNYAILKVEAAKTRYDKSIVRKKLVDKPYREDEIKVFSLKVDKATEEKKNAKGAYERTSKLFSDGFVSQKEMDDVETRFNIALTAMEIAKRDLKVAIDGSREEEIESSEKEVMIAKRDLDIVESDLKKSRIISTVNGTISNKYVEAGEVVTVGQVLAEIVVLNPLKVSFAVSERELSFLNKSTNVNLTIPALKKTISGKVGFVSPVADTKTHLFNIELFVQNEDKSIYPGMTAKITLSTNTITAYPIRADWLRFNYQQLGVFVLSQKTVKFIPVNQENYLAKEILLYEGIEEGDEIIIFSSHKLVPGQQIDN